MEKKYVVRLQFLNATTSRFVRKPCGLTTTLELADQMFSSSNWPQFRGIGSRGLSDGLQVPQKWSVEAGAETRARIEQVRRQIGDLKVKRAIADLEGMAQAMVGDLDSGGASLSRLEEMIVEERDKAGARARVAQSSAGALPPGTSEAVRGAMAEAALAEFLSPDPRALPDMRSLPDTLTETLSAKTGTPSA